MIFFFFNIKIFFFFFNLKEFENSDEIEIIHKLNLTLHPLLDKEHFPKEFSLNFTSQHGIINGHFEELEGLVNDQSAHVYVQGKDGVEKRSSNMVSIIILKK
jgi:hypothetical protein